MHPTFNGYGNMQRFSPMDSKGSKIMFEKQINRTFSINWKRQV